MLRTNDLILLLSVIPLRQLADEMKISHSPNPEGRTDFHQLHPLGAGQKVDENKE
jgi:hypothetical protein